jgi:hypothetical protein
MESTVFVTLCDAPYFHKAHQTIKDLRIHGAWTGPIVLIVVDFAPPPDFLEKYAVTTVSFPRLDLAAYLDKIRAKPFSVPTNDGRELKKTTQWEKLHAFNPYFQQWARQIWVDAGMRILEDVRFLLEVRWEGTFTAPSETYNFELALETRNWPHELFEAQGKFDFNFNDKFFINCFWIYDTRLRLKTEDFLDCLNYPIWRHNEMGAMNAIIAFKARCWTPLPLHATNGKYLYAWSEFDYKLNWNRFCVIKYPVGIRFDV